MWKNLLFGPIICTLVGAAVGISWAMLYRQEPSAPAHVYIDDSLPCANLGAALGFLIG